MPLSDLADKLERYRARVADGSAERISTADVEKMLSKLKGKHRKLTARIEELDPADPDREQLEEKLARVDLLMERAYWLRAHL